MYSKKNCCGVARCRRACVLVGWSWRLAWVGGSHGKHVNWDYITKIVDILEFFKKPTIKLQGSSSNTYTILYISQLYNKLKEISCIVDDCFIKEGLKQAIDKLLYYFPINSNNINKLKDLFIITLLDLHFKLEIFTFLEYNIEIISNIKKYFIEVYKRYKE